MIIFNSDLDNTIIYSYKHDIGENKICAEIYQEREISFITDKTKELLKKVVGTVTMVPTTTRTIEQYERIDLGVGTFKYALVCNGGVLLVDGKEDEEWYRDSVKLISDSKAEMKKAAELMEHDIYRNFELRYIKELFLFTKSSEPEMSVAHLREQLDLDKVEVLSNGVKVYVVPKNLDKGTAVVRLKKKLGADTVIAAGDSEFDIPMLFAADYGIAPKELLKSRHADVKLIEKEDMFSEKVLEEVLSITEKYSFASLQLQ